MSAALAARHTEVAQAVQEASSKNVDETIWAERGQKRWLWVAVTRVASLFVIHTTRGAAGFAALLGETVHDIISSDRWVVYEQVPDGRRQFCWAHLKRGFQAMVDRGGAGQAIGEQLLELAGMMFDWWYMVRDGTRQRRCFVSLVEEVSRPDVRCALERGLVCDCAKTAATCRELLAVESALWTFATQAGVETTSNAAERALRPAVLWRKRSFGCHSDGGCRYIERLLTAVATLECQGQDVLDYL
jgi:transposase